MHTVKIPFTSEYVDKINNLFPSLSLYLRKTLGLLDVSFEILKVKGAKPKEYFFSSDELATCNIQYHFNSSDIKMIFTKNIFIKMGPENPPV